MVFLVQLSWIWVLKAKLISLASLEKKISFVSSFICSRRFRKLTLDTLGTGSIGTSIRACRSFDTSGSASCCPGRNTISYACQLLVICRCSRGGSCGGCSCGCSSCTCACCSCRGSRCNRRCCLKAIRISRSITIIGSCWSYSIVITREVTNTTRWPSGWIWSVIHDSSNIGTSLSTLIPNTVYIPTVEIVKHTKIMSKFMCNDLNNYKKSLWEND